MRNSLLILVLLLFKMVTASAQHEADNWCFGTGGGVTFKNGSASILAGVRTGAMEGCASISDNKTGSLLFYTNGVTVWNGKHEVMKNGTELLGGLSSTQSALIVPNPSNALQYYIFTSPDLTSGTSTNKSLHYSLVSLETPDGEVVYKNYSLYSDVSEKLTGTLDCSGKGFWVVAHHSTKGIFYSFHVTSTGVNQTPVISTYTNETINSLAGYMKISPDRTKLALASGVISLSIPFPLMLFNFNAETGLITLNNVLSVGMDIKRFYGVAFSPDNSKLYATEDRDMRVNSLGSIVQYDLSLPNPSAVQQSRFIYKMPPPSPNASTYGWALQLAPDGKIYVSTGLSYLSVIEKPNMPGEAFSYKVSGISLGFGTSRLGLPNFMDYIFNQPLPGPNPLAWCTPPPPPPPDAIASSDSGCIGSTLKFTDLSTQKPTNREWTFENGTPATSTDSIVTVTYSLAGTHRVSLKVSNDNGSDSTITQAIIFPFPPATAGADKTVCLGTSTELGAPAETGNTYSWQPPTNLDDATKSKPTVTPITNGTTKYILTVTSNHGCVSYDTVLVTAGSIVAKVSSDTSLCIGSSVQLMASGGSEYEWSPSTGLDNPTIPNPIASPGITTTYKVRVSSGSTCEDSATVTVTVNPFPTANAGIDISLCRGETSVLGAPSEGDNIYQWQPVTGLNDATKSNPNVTPTVTTEYILTVTNSTGCSSKDTVLVTVGNIKAIVSNDTSICAGTSVQLSAGGGSIYKWSPIEGLDNPNSVNPICTINSKTVYKVIVSSGFCVDSAYVTVDIAPSPIANAGADQTPCKGDTSVLGAPSQDGNTYQWQPVAGLDNPTKSNPSMIADENIQYILTVTNPTGCVSHDTVLVTVKQQSEHSFTLSSSTATIIPGQSFQVLLHIPSGVFSWDARLGYDNLVMKYTSVSSKNNGITFDTPKEEKGELVLLNGKGSNGDIVLNFDAFLPYNSDTTFPIKLSVDNAKTLPCESVSTRGTTVELGIFCGRRIRTVNSTGKNYFLINKENGVNFGVGLSGRVRLELYDYTGTLKEIVADGNMEAGEYSIDFDLPTGVYFCRINTGMYSDITKIMVLEK